ncbi:MAG: hypothetical protein ACFCGT_12685 [Sandaracinaceae bacterium]
MRNAAWIGILLTPVVGACGASTPEPDVPEAEVRSGGPVDVSGEAEARAMVGPDGGTLRLSDGTVLEVPAGALADEQEIVFSLGPEGRAFAESTQHAVGPALAVQPYVESQDQRSRPFIVSMPAVSLPDGFDTEHLTLAVEEEDRQRGGMDVLNTRTRWQYYHAELRDGRFQAVLPVLHGHRMQFGVFH